MAVNGVGDVIALVQITALAAKTLHGAVHAPDEIKRFVDEIDRYQACVETAAGRLRHHGALLKSHNDVKRNIQGVLEQCAETTLKLRKIANKYQHIVRERGPPADKKESWNQWIEAFKTVYHAIEWTSKSDLVDKLRTELARNVQMLTWLEGGLTSDRLEQLMIEMSKIHDILTSAISSPTRTPMSSPFGLSPKAPSYATSPGSQITSPSLQTNAQIPPLAPPLTLSEPMLDVDDDWDFGHKIDSELRFSDKFSFPDVTPGDGYRHVKQASEREQQRFVEQIAKGKEVIELPVVAVNFIWHKPGSQDSVQIDASDRGKVLLVKNGQAVEDIWTLNDKRTIRFRQRVPTWDDIIPYSPNGDEGTAAIEQGDGLTFFTIEDGRRQDHPRISTTWVNYKFFKVSDCERFQQIVYGCGLRLLVPVNAIYRPHRGRDDDRLANFENLRVWERGAEMRLMVNLIQEKGKRRKKYLEFDLYQDNLKVESKGSGSKSILAFTGVNVTIDEFVFERRGSTSSLNSASSATSMKRRFSWNQSSPFLDKVDVHFNMQEDRDSLHHLALSCRPTQRLATRKAG